MHVVPTSVPATWQVQDPDRHRIAGLHFVRITGPDGVPGLSGVAGIVSWQTDIDAATSKPDMTGQTRVGPDGAMITPKEGDWVITRDNGDLKLWVLGVGGTPGTAIDLPDGTVGPPGDPATAQHTHTYTVATNSYQLVRDKFAGAVVSKADTIVVR